LERRHVELREQVGALEVERGREERDVDFTRMSLQLRKIACRQLERLAVLAVRSPEAGLVVVRLIEELARVQSAIRALLQLDGIGPAFLGGVDQLLRLLETALMVVPDLRDDVARATVMDLDTVDRQPAFVAHRSMLVAGVRRRSRSASTSRWTSCSKPSSGLQSSRSRACEAL